MEAHERAKRQASALIKWLFPKMDGMELAYMIQEFVAVMRSYGRQEWDDGFTAGSLQAQSDIHSLVNILEEHKADPKVIDIVRRVARIIVR